MRVALIVAVCLSLCASAVAASGPFENNDTFQQAKKIKVGKRVSAAIETIANPGNTLVDDRDWYFFRAKRAGRVTITFKTIGNEGVPCFGPTLSAISRKQKNIKFVQPANGKSAKLRYRARKGKNYLLASPHNVQQCDTPERYRIKIAK